MGLMKMLTDKLCSLVSYETEGRFLVTGVCIVICHICQKDSCYADEINLYFRNTNINIKRDIREISNWKNIRGFMKTIPNSHTRLFKKNDSMMKVLHCLQIVSSGE